MRRKRSRRQTQRLCLFRMSDKGSAWVGCGPKAAGASFLFTSSSSSAPGRDALAASRNKCPSRARHDRDSSSGRPRPVLPLGPLFGCSCCPCSLASCQPRHISSRRLFQSTLLAAPAAAPPRRRHRRRMRSLAACVTLRVVTLTAAAASVVTRLRRPWITCDLSID